MKSLGRIYLVDDDELILSMLTRTLEKEGYEVRTDAGEKKLIEKILAWHPDVVLLDINVPGQNGMEVLKTLKNDAASESEVIMLTADDTAETAVKAMKIGAWDYLTKPFNIDEVKIVIGNAIENIKLKKELEYLRKINSSLFESEFLGASKAKKELKDKLERLADARVSCILITGESGVGKEVIARNIHQMMHGTASSSIPFIAVNCSALPDTLLESELFGYEKGAFTDAKKSKKGLFEVADGGTLLLDELGEMKLSLQSKLLRALEERVVRRIGGEEEIPVDVTVIATTNRDLSIAVEKGEFRMDLYYRLNSFALNVPALRDRDRRDDIPLLARHFLASFAKEYNKPVEGFSPEAAKLMMAYRWPGNVRELKNVVRGIVVLQNAKVIMPEHLPLELSGLAAVHSNNKGRGRQERFTLTEAGVSLDELEKDLIIQALDIAGHNNTKAAKLLNISYDSFRYQLKKFNLK